MIGRQCLYVLRKNPLKASALNEDKPKAPDEFSTATPEVERERVLPKNIHLLLPPAGSASLPPARCPNKKTGGLYLPEIFSSN